MAKTYLSGNGPDESEPLTESQINDARRPTSMAMSTVFYAPPTTKRQPLSARLATQISSRSPRTSVLVI